MAFHHRKININPYDNTQTVRLKEAPHPPKPCHRDSSEDCILTVYPRFPPPHLNDDYQSNQRHQMSSILILMFCIFGATVCLFCYLAIVKCYKNWTNSRRRNPQTPPIFDDVNEDFIDANLGPVLDHPIWYINTIGLQQSVINSITIFKYKKDEGLIEGTECSVCLNEFQEDDSLRLLPKCGHAFHVPCIDTWLRSHKNCPLCRAPIVTDSNNAHLSIAEPNLSDLGSNEEARVENLENYGGLGSHRVGEDGSSEMRIGAASLEEETIDEISEKNSSYFSARNSDSRVRSDLADHRLKVEEELQPRRRSVSMDSSSASTIYLAMANIPPAENEGCSDSHLVQVKKPNREIVAKRAKRNSSIYRMVMKSSSFRRCLQKEPVSMKRSFSSSGNLSFCPNIAEARIQSYHCENEQSQYRC